MPETEGASDRGVIKRAAFTATSWTAILTARQEGSPEAAAALEKLCRTYWYPLYAHIRRRGFDAEQAQDLTQEFFYRLLKEHTLGAVDRKRGKFRTFLLAALDNFLSDQRQRAAAQKRGGGYQIVSLDAEAEERYRLEPATTLSPDKLFMRRWFVTLHEQVVAQLRQEAQAVGKVALFERLEIYLTSDTGRGDYRETAAELNMKLNAVAVAVHRLRQRCQELWRAEIARTVASPEEIQGEIRHLFAALGD